MLGKMLLSVAWHSLWYRRISVLITIAAIGVSVFTLLSTEHVRQAAKHSFSSTVSGVDLIVGPRTSDVNLLLTTVFRIGQPSQNMSWQSYQNLLNHKNVAWAIPISLGDSHKRFRVVGTESQFFTKFQYGQSRALTFTSGKAFTKLYDVVLGARVVEELGYRVGDKFVLSHGMASVSFKTHDAYPFNVSGVLKTTGTPVDNALYVSLAGLEAIHQPSTAQSSSLTSEQLVPASISAAMVGLSSKFATFKVQRELNTSTQEPLTAILPGVALAQLWQMSRGVERALEAMTHLILLASLLGLGAMMMATLRERSYEFSVLRTLGAGSKTIFVLIQTESALVAILGIALGSAAFLSGILFADGMLAANYGIDIGPSRITYQHGISVLFVFCGTLLAGAVPAFMGYVRTR